MSLTHTQNDLGAVVIRDAEFRDELLTLADADELAAGTILARDSDTGNLVLFDPDADPQDDPGANVPQALLVAPVTASAGGNVPVRALIRGVVNRQRLIIDADGDGDDITGAIIDQLRACGITPVDVKELGKIDNA